MHYSYNAPSSMFTNQTILNNGNTRIIHGSPLKPDTMTQGGDYSNSKAVYASGTKNNNIKKMTIHKQGSSDVTYLKKMAAIGKSSNKVGLQSNADMTYRSKDSNYKNHRIRLCRSGGSVAPPKKGAI